MPGLLLIAILLTGCSSKPSSPPTAAIKEFEKLHAKHLPLHQACIEHRDNILEQAVTEIEEAPIEDDKYVFVPNETDATYFIVNFDLSKFTLKENQVEYEAVVEACMNGPQAGHANCETLISSYKYFRALIPAIAHNPWSSQIKNKAKQNILNYLHYVGKSESSLMDVILANDLLQRISEKKLLSIDVSRDSKRFKQKAEQEFERLRAEVRRLGKKELSCDEARVFYRKERKRVKALSQEFLSLLNKVRL